MTACSYVSLGDNAYDAWVKSQAAVAYDGNLLAFATEADAQAEFPGLVARAGEWCHAADGYVIRRTSGGEQ